MAGTASQTRRVRIVCISDTHNQTPKLPDGDILIHAGDLTNQGSPSEIQKVVRWLEKADFKIKIVVAGNHDLSLDNHFGSDPSQSSKRVSLEDRESCTALLRDSPTLTYLEHTARDLILRADEGLPETKLKVFGSPYSMREGTWAFGYEASNASELWSDIPLDSDIVVTHGPPWQHCDKGPSGAEGCKALLERLSVVRPVLHVCGHKHYGRGAELVCWKEGGTSGRLESFTGVWHDPGAGLGNKKLSKVGLTRGRGDGPWQERAESNANKASSADQDAGREAGSEALSDSTTGSETADRSLSRNHDGALHLEDLDHGTVSVRSETCIVNASYMASSYGQHKNFNKPIVVDIDLPVRL